MSDEQQEEIIVQLETLNRQIAQQQSHGRVFVLGIIYGIGFFIGSAIIATITLGALSPWVGKIDWIRNDFERGSSLQQFQ